MIRPRAFVFLICLLVYPVFAMGSVLTSDTTWSGEVTVDQDVLVPKGITLTIAAGTKIRVTAAESTKTDPEYMSSLTEITVRGALVVDGTKGDPVVFRLEPGQKGASWAGIIVDGGKAVLNACTVSNAEAGVTVINGSLSLADSLLTKNRYGLVAQGAASAVRIRSTRITENDYGLVLLNGAAADSTGGTIGSNRKKDRYSAAAAAVRLQGREYASGEKSGKSMGYADDVLLGTTVWRGRIEVNGVIRVPEGSRLVVAPGTVVEFKKKDTNSDGIGENGILVQGVIIAKGTREHPIVFRSAEKQRSMGDWDSINIMNSDGARNLIEYCRIEDAYRGLHFHFSNVAVSESVIRNNYRGIQFQESVVEIRGTFFSGNKSAVQARDSEILFAENVVSGNTTGLNLFRNSMTVKDSLIVNNLQEGLRVREGLPVVERNLLDGNRYGLMVNNAVYGTFAGNVISHNLEAGISLRETDNIEFTGNAVQANGLYGISIQEASAVIRGNLISDNGERGIGVQSFAGAITGNNILKNGLYNLGIDGPGDVSASGNWWGGEDLQKTVFDKQDDPAKGRAACDPVLERPVLFSWPLAALPAPAQWHGDIAVNTGISVEPGVQLTVSPNTRVLFSRGAGLAVRGKIVARGDKNAVITFAALQGSGPELWDEVLVDHAGGSVFSHCFFRNATWAVHSHFTDLKVEACRFEDNYGGMRFTSGPIEIRHSLFEGNEIGIRAFRAKALITENIITRNRIGIFVREKGGGLSITRNNLFANSDYNLRMGDFNDEDVDARGNWWGGSVPAQAIYDARTEPGIGTVQFEPFAGKPFTLEAPAAGSGGKK